MQGGFTNHVSALSAQNAEQTEHYVCRNTNTLINQCGLWTFHELHGSATPYEAWIQCQYIQYLRGEFEIKQEFSELVNWNTANFWFEWQNITFAKPCFFLCAVSTVNHNSAFKIGNYLITGVYWKPHLITPESLVIMSKLPVMICFKCLDISKLVGFFFRFVDCSGLFLLALLIGRMFDCSGTKISLMIKKDLLH